MSSSEWSLSVKKSPPIHAMEMLRTRGLETSDFETARTHIATVSQGRCQFFIDRPSMLERFGYFEATLGSTRLQLLSWRTGGDECTTATKRVQDLILYVPLEGSFVARHGRHEQQISPGDLFFVSADGPSSRRWTGPSTLLNVIVPREAILRMLAADFAIAADEGLDLPAFARLSAAENDTFCRLVETFMWDLSSPRPVFNGSSSDDHAERALLHALIRSIPGFLCGKFAIPDAQASGPSYLRRVHAFITRNIGENLSIEDLVAASGVSTRTLFYGFKRFWRTTPQRHVKAVKLKFAREALLRSAETNEAISSIALRFGYQNVAHFSKDYRRMYGVSPSDALRSSPL